jgi:hypothetical protein
LYHLYIDESGIEELIIDPTKKCFDSDWFTSGGIIVNDASKYQFEQIHSNIITDCFINKGINLPANFKLHYHDLRQNTYPYNQITDNERWGIANTIFNAINTIDCKLVSATIHKPSHEAKYDWSVNVKAYTLLICLERFQFFLEDVNNEGNAIYERFTNSLRRKMTQELQQLQSIPTFPYFTNLNKIKGKVKNGDPSKEVLLQFSDFFVYAPHIKLVTCHRKQKRWQEIKEKYYELYGIWKKRGFVIL